MDIDDRVCGRRRERKGSERDNEWSTCGNENLFWKNIHIISWVLRIPLTLHPSYLPQNKHLIDEAAFKKMKKGVLLINLSRGPIVKESALITNLKNGQIAGAALDVFETEPLPADSELWDMENLLITPHVAGGTQFETQYILDIFRENLERFMRGELPLRNQIDKQKGF